MSKTIEITRYKFGKALVWLANHVTNRNPGWPPYHYVDNTNYYSLEYLQSYDKNEPIKSIWEGWIDVTDENAQSVIDDLQRAVDFAVTKDEQDKLNAQ